MIDKKQPLDVCKIQTIQHINYRIERDKISNEKALRAIAKEADIPYNTIKRWFYDGKKEDKVETPVSLVTQTPLVSKDKLIKQTPETPVSDNKKRRPLRLLPELDNSIIEYKNKHKLKHADAFVQLLELGLKNQDTVFMGLDLRKELKYVNENIAEPMGLPTTEALHFIADHYLYYVKKETEQR